MSEYNYALLKYGTTNIGDEIQSIAAKQFLPRVDAMFARDHLNEVKVDKPTKIILNGWFSHKPHNWPITDDKIKPLFISFHISDEHGSSVEKLLRKEAIEYYKKHEPIGTRDMNTLKLLKDKGVDAYFSGCLTLTLRNRFSERNDLIYCVDAYVDRVKKVMPNRLHDKLVSIKHGKLGFDSERNFQAAQEHLDLYAQAKLVITSRLHCAMPCVAFGTPVIFVHDNINDPRFGGLINLTKHCTVEQFLNKSISINWDRPEPNPGNITEIRNKLIDTCTSFINS